MKKPSKNYKGGGRGGRPNSNRRRSGGDYQRRHESTGSKLYVGKICPLTCEDELRELYEKAGTVLSCDLMLDKTTGRSRGFAFIEMENDEGAKKAISMYHGYKYEEYTWSVTEARPRR